MILYVSSDGSTLLHDVHDAHPAEYEWVEVPDTLTLTVRDLCGHDGNILEILLSAGKAKYVTDRRNL